MKESILDKYALNQLTNEDKVWLKNALAKDPSLQQELDLYTDIVNGMAHYMDQKNTNELKAKIADVGTHLEQDGFFETPLNQALIQQIQLEGEKELQQIIRSVDKNLEQDGFFRHQDHSKNTSTSFFKRLKPLIAAASILLILSLGWQLFAPATFDTEEQYTLAFKPYENTLSNSIELELSEHGFGGNPKTVPLNQLLEAMAVYDKGNYAKASQLLSDVLKDGVDANFLPATKFYLALSYMGDNAHDKALPILQKISAQEFTQQETATWYLALVYLKEGNLKASEQTLERLNSSKQYRQKATQLLSTFPK
ncbi:tetratricopeptide repeat protein [Aureispira anguillae]|uniref:Tetratricopeptide repeat protein n=1 Tax=Aureispira anguillae TaxID=2864201 RepID=A0A916DXB8_9BACT|nr:hypothetical protein [Aureispira anguillae]BDS15595.1 hypothetical protein AsAng_0063790 [Aureispira anguillae]